MPKYTQNAYTYQPRASQGPILPQFVHDYLAYGVKSHRNDTLHKVACQFLHAGIAQADIEPQLMARAMQDGLSAAEAQKTINSAFRGEKRDPCGFPSQSQTHYSVPPKQFVPPPGVQRPFSMPLPSPIKDGLKIYLERGFQSGEKVAISSTIIDALGRHPGPGDLYGREHWLSQIAVKPIEKYYPGDEGIYIRINPISGSHANEVTSFRHALFEADKDGNGKLIPKEEQYAALVNSHLPIRFIVDSGYRSIHGIVILDAPDRKEYDRRWALALTALEGHWIDVGSNKSPERYSRVPGVDRKLYDDNDNFVGIGRQELLAIDIGEASWDEWEAKYVKDPLDAEIERVMRFRKVSELSQVRPRQLVEGLLYQGTKMMFVAPSKSFKTWNLLHFFFCVANGLPYMGRQTVKTPVVYLDFELLQFDLWWRLSRIAAAYNLPGDPFENFYVVSLGGELLFGEEEIDFAHPKVRAFLVREINRINAGLFGIDPIYMTYCGDDENSNSGKILSKFDPICRQTGAAFVYNHHFSKGDPTGKNPFDRASGGGIFYRNVYTGVAFTPHQVADAFTVNFALRGFSAIAPYVVRWQMPLMTPDSTLDPDDLASMKTSNQRSSGKNTQDKILAAIYGAEREGGLTTQQLEHVVGVNARTIQRHAKTLISKAEIIRSPLKPHPYSLSASNSAIWLQIMP